MKKLLFLFFALIFLASAQEVGAQSANLREYIADPSFQSHTLSTGEDISFEATGGPGPSGTSPVRMHKGGNYEQFYIGGSGIYRGEDTSWAPLPGFVDAHCQDGSKAAYTLVSSCGPYQGRDGVLWAINSASVGQNWSTPNHAVATIRADTSAAKTACSLSDLGGYPACNQSQTILFEQFYEPQELTFCTGIENEAEVVKLRVTSGYGQGDTFYFMKGWGLVGFEAPGFESGLMGPGANASGCEGGGAPTPTEIRRPITEGFYPGKYQCSSEIPNEFAPLRPYPANSCDPLIPQSRPAAAQNTVPPDAYKYITYSCGNSLSPTFPEAFDPYGNNDVYETRVVSDGTTNYAHTVCDDVQGGKVTCYRTETIDLTVDLGDANVGIFGNSQTPDLTNEQMVNEYLLYYFMGIPQTVDRLPEDVSEEEAIANLINFSGPFRKLAPYELQNVEVRSTIALAGVEKTDIHNYQVANGIIVDRLSDFSGNLPPDPNDSTLPTYLRSQFDWRYGQIPVVDFLRSLFGYQRPFAKLFQNIPLGSLEDTAGEFLITIFPQGSDHQDSAVANPQPRADGLTTAPTKVIITNANQSGTYTPGECLGEGQMCEDLAGNSLGSCCSGTCSADATGIAVCN